MPVSYPFQNRMTKLLSGSPIQTAAAGDNWTFPTVRRKALKRALGIVRSTEDFLFGLAEELDLTLELFKFVFRRKFNVPSNCHSHRNTSNGGCDNVEIGLHDQEGNPLFLGEKELLYFKENNYEDEIVYNMAARLFQDRVQAMRALQSLGSDALIDRRCQEILAEDMMRSTSTEDTADTAV